MPLIITAPTPRCASASRLHWDPQIALACLSAHPRPASRAQGKQLNKQSLAPCTIKQLKNAPASGGDNGFTVDGKDLHQVTIVGLITRADEQNTNLQYTIDDGTDSINVKMWIDAATDEAAIEKRAQWRCALARSPRQPPPHRLPRHRPSPSCRGDARREGAVVRVIGQMRAFNQVRSIVAFHIQPLTDFNEYTFHFIEVVHTHLRNTKGAAVSEALLHTPSTPHAPHTPRAPRSMRATRPRPPARLPRPPVGLGGPSPSDSKSLAPCFSLHKF